MATEDEDEQSAPPPGGYIIPKKKRAAKHEVQKHWRPLGSRGSRRFAEDENHSENQPLPGGPMTFPPPAQDILLPGMSSADESSGRRRPHARRIPKKPIRDQKVRANNARVKAESEEPVLEEGELLSSENHSDDGNGEWERDQAVGSADASAEAKVEQEPTMTRGDTDETCDRTLPPPSVETEEGQQGNEENIFPTVAGGGTLVEANNVDLLLEQELALMQPVTRRSRRHVPASDDSSSTPSSAVAKDVRTVSASRPSRHALRKAAVPKEKDTIIEEPEPKRRRRSSEDNRLRRRKLKRPENSSLTDMATAVVAISQPALASEDCGIEDPLPYLGETCVGNGWAMEECPINCPVLLNWSGAEYPAVQEQQASLLVSGYPMVTYHQIANRFGVGDKETPSADTHYLNTEEVKQQTRCTKAASIALTSMDDLLARQQSLIEVLLATMPGELSDDESTAESLLERGSYDSPTECLILDGLGLGELLEEEDRELLFDTHSNITGATLEAMFLQREKYCKFAVSLLGEEPNKEDFECVDCMLQITQGALPR